MNKKKINNIRIFDDVAIIELSNGKYTIIDSEDVDKIIKYRLKYRKIGNISYCYAIKWVNNKDTMCGIHRLLLKTKDIKICVDHINGDGLDNRKSNLRIATKKENCRNSQLSKNNTSGYKGVTFDKQKNKWQAQIKINYKNKKLGRFNSPEEAYAAYCEAAKKYHEEFACY